MNQMSVNVEQTETIIALTNDMSVPDLVVKRCQDWSGVGLRREIIEILGASVTQSKRTYSLIFFLNQ